MMKKGLFTLLLMITTALPALAAPGNTSGPWGINVNPGAFTSFSAAKNSPVTLNKTMVLSAVIDVGTVTVTDRELDIKRGGGFNISAGSILTIPRPNAGRYQIFYGDGTVNIDGGGGVYPEWWGAYHDYTHPTETTIALNAAFNCVKNGADAYAPSKPSGGAGRIDVILEGGYTINGPLDMSQRDYTRLLAKSRATILSIGMGYIIDMSSADHCQINNIKLVSTTASVGIYMNRCTSNPYNMFNRLTDVSITLGSIPSANGGKGTIGIYVNRAEQNVFTNLELRTDVPLWAEALTNGSMPPVFGVQNTSINSCTVNTFIQCNFISNGTYNYASILDGLIGFEFINCYWARASINTGTIVTAISAKDLSRCKFSGSVEVLARFMHVIGTEYMLDVDVIMQTSALDSGGIFGLLNTGGISAIIDSRLRVLVAGGTPAVGACIVKESGTSSSNLKGNIIETTSLMIPYTTTNTVISKNIIKTEALLTIDGNSTSTGISGVTAAVASGVPVTILTTSGQKTYTVTAYINGSGASFMGTAKIINDGANPIIVTQNHGAYMIFSISGQDVLATQTSGGAAQIRYQIVTTP